MEDLIYVLIALLWIFFSVIKGRQQQTAAREKENERKTRTPWEEMLEEMLPADLEQDDEEPLPAKPVMQHKTRLDDEERVESVSPYAAYNVVDYDENNSIPEIISLEEVDEVSPMLISRALPGEIGNQNHDQYSPALLIELRRAVVYNAILERPKW